MRACVTSSFAPTQDPMSIELDYETENVLVSRLCPRSCLALFIYLLLLLLLLLLLVVVVHIQSPPS